jgi:hypothetical protein
LSRTTTAATTTLPKWPSGTPTTAADDDGWLQRLFDLERHHLRRHD